MSLKASGHLLATGPKKTPPVAAGLRLAGRGGEKPA
jgi:hypothetical protein